MAANSIAPVVVLSTSPAGQLPGWATVALPAGPRVAGAPLTWSLAATLAIGVEAMPAVAAPFSLAGTMSAVMVTVAVAAPQSAGVAWSHSWKMSE